MNKEQLLQRTRQHFSLVALWPLLKLAGTPYPNYPQRSPFRPGDRTETFVPKSPAMWVDRHPSGNGFIRGDSFTLLCHLRGCDPDQPAAAVVDEFLSMAVQAEVIRPEELGEVVEAERKMGQMLAEKTESSTGKPRK